MLPGSACIRKWREREAVFAMDDGQAAPLTRKQPREGPWGGLHATEQLAPAYLLPWKASVVGGCDPTSVITVRVPVWCS